jgi:hypothetical protein
MLTPLSLSLSAPVGPGLVEDEPEEALVALRAIVDAEEEKGDWSVGVFPRASRQQTHARCPRRR